MKNFLLSTFACLSLATFVAAAEPKSDEVKFTVGFELLPADFLESDVDDGSVILSDVEAFFLYKRGKTDPNENWPPKERVTTVNVPFNCRYTSDTKANFTLKITPGPECEGKVPITVEAPEGSAFTFKRPVRLDLIPGAVLYLPCATTVRKLENSKNLIVYLHLRVAAPEDEDEPLPLLTDSRYPIWFPSKPFRQLGEPNHRRGDF